MMDAKIYGFGLVVEDIPRSLEFYRHVGLDIPAEADKEPHVQVTLPGGIHLIWDSADTIRSFQPDWREPTGGHRVAIAFACPDPAGVDAAYARLTGLGHQGLKEPWDAVWQQRYAIVLDPDGNHVELFAPLG
ncbi:VOC family protein [Actinomadura viridis]|uniref:VOC family protein n=1 Tax=Actinomadura viridis TaxID=58110 RepID=UPI0036A8B345